MTAARRRLVDASSVAEFWIASHAQSAAYAREYAQRGYRDGARRWGEIARREIAAYWREKGLQP